MTDQVQGSTGSFEVAEPQFSNRAMHFPPRLAGAMTIRPGGPSQASQGRRSMDGALYHKGQGAGQGLGPQGQDSMGATAKGSTWLGLSHDLRAQRAKEVLLQVLPVAAPFVMVLYHGQQLISSQGHVTSSKLAALNSFPARTVSNQARLQHDLHPQPNSGGGGPPLV